MSIALRTRAPWEAIDLGAAMLRAWWRPVYGAWLVVVLPIALVASVALAAWPTATLLLIWWLKPLYDRVVLHVLARGVFGETPTVRETLAGLRGVFRSGLIGALTLRRLDVARSFNLPVRQLEGLHGPDARGRERVLGRRAHTQATGLMLSCLMFEMVIVFSLTALLEFLTPAAHDTDVDLDALFGDLWGANAPSWAAYLINGFCVIAISIMEPLYVASGFALYLNRRTTLEAWDLELSFRVMAAQHPRGTLHGATLALIVVLCVLDGVTMPPSHAAQASSREIIEQVLAAPEFQEHRTEKVWRPKQAARPSEPTAWPWAVSAIMKMLSAAIAELARFGAYALLVVAAYFLIIYLVREVRKRSLGQTPPGPAHSAPEILFGLDVRPEALPHNLSAVAAAIAQSDPRTALSLLYRGALATLIHRDRLDFGNGDTEADCVRRVEHAADVGTSAYFRRLVTAWSRAAYAKQPPEHAAVASLCADWAMHFSASQPSP